MNRLLAAEEILIELGEGTPVEFVWWQRVFKYDVSRTVALRAWERFKSWLKKDGIPFRLEDQGNRNIWPVVFERGASHYVADKILRIFDQKKRWSAQRARYLRNREEQLAASKAWYEAHKNDPEYRARCRKTAKDWARRNPARAAKSKAARNKRYREKHREKLLEYSREYYQRNKDKWRERYKKGKGARDAK